MSSCSICGSETPCGNSIDKIVDRTVDSIFDEKNKQPTTEKRCKRMRNRQAAVQSSNLGSNTESPAFKEGDLVAIRKGYGNSNSREMNPWTITRITRESDGWFYSLYKKSPGSSAITSFLQEALEIWTPGK